MWICDVVVEESWVLHLESKMNEASHLGANFFIASEDTTQ
jgi:hypothetical protein